MDVTLGAFSRPWTSLPYEAAIAEMSKTFGVGGIMKNDKKFAIALDSSPEEARAAVEIARGFGVEIVAFIAPVPSVKESAEACARDFKHYVDLAAAGGVEHILSTGINDTRLAPDFTRALRDAVPYAAEKGVTIGLKPHGGITATGADCRRFAEEIGRAGFGLWFDPGNFIHYDNLDPSEELKPMAEYCVAVCLKDCGRNSDGSANVQILPGTGEVNFESCLGILSDSGFSGPMLFECLGGDSVDEINANARKALRFIESILATL